MKLRNNLMFLFFMNIVKSDLTRCTNKICDEVGGTCIDDKICECNENYSTLLNNNNIKLCNYLKISKYSTAFLELFIGFGIGHFYSHRRVNGFFKMLFFMLLCYVACCTIAIGLKFYQDNQNIPDSSAKFFFFIYNFIINLLMTWQVFDFLMFIFGIYKDGNNIPFA